MTTSLPGWQWYSHSDFIIGVGSVGALRAMPPSVTDQKVYVFEKLCFAQRRDANCFSKISGGHKVHFLVKTVHILILCPPQVWVHATPMFRVRHLWLYRWLRNRRCVIKLWCNLIESMSKTKWLTQTTHSQSPLGVNDIRYYIKQNCGKSHLWIGSRYVYADE